MGLRLDLVGLDLGCTPQLGSVDLSQRWRGLKGEAKPLGYTGVACSGCTLKDIPVR